MPEVFAAVLPIFTLILLGWLFRRSPLLEDYGWTALERLTYFVLFPCLLATTIADADFSGLAMQGVAVAIVSATGLVSLALLAARRLVRTDGPAFTSIFQGSVRMNTYIGLSIAAMLFADEGLVAAALAIAVIVPLVNVACVLVLTWYGTSSKRGWQSGVKACLTNPLLLGTFTGLALNWSGLGMPPLIGPMAEILAEAALPLGLLAVGAALDFDALGQAGGVVLSTSAVKLIALPLLTLQILQLLDVEGLEASIAVLFNALPTATSSYILASQYGGDARLMAGIITAQTLLSMLTLPAILALLL